MNGNNADALKASQAAAGRREGNSDISEIKMIRFATDEVQDFEREHAEMARKGAAECALFLKRNGDFPVQPCRVNLYGSGARRTIKGGKGSGDVNSRHTVSVEEGLENAGFEIATKEWLDEYDRLADKAVTDFWDELQRLADKMGTSPYVLVMNRACPPVEYDMPLSGDGELNLYVIARNQSEGMDRKNIKGDYRLSDSEVRDIRKLSKRKAKLMVVLNVGAPVDLSPIRSCAKNILLLSQLGAGTGTVFADMLTGKAYPSGKLAATWSAYKDCPSKDCFGASDEADYLEGVFVGYRYFSTFGIEPQYPFGYGLGYTDFAFAPTRFTVSGNRVDITVKVTNTGNFPGKEVIQIYFANTADTEAPLRQLIAFGKTGELAPGESEDLCVPLDITDAAAYNEDVSAYILAAGKYLLYAGNSSENTVCACAVEIKDDVVCERVTSLGGSVRELCRIAPAPQDEPVLGIKAICPVARSRERKGLSKPERAASMTDEQLARMCVGVLNDMTLTNNIGNSGKLVAGAAGETYSDEDTEAVVLADGSCGLRISPTYCLDEEGRVKASQNALAGLLPGGVMKTEPDGGTVYYQHCTAIPIPTALAQTWNMELCGRMGSMVGEEMDIFGVDLWLAPAINIQRNPLCGRNFEYYSEDPLLSGLAAAAVTNGVQSHAGRGVTVKHFAANNQETNRFFCSSNVSEKAMRDIYLKPFKICIEKASPASMMTSYNLLNGVHTANNPKLLRDILRGEWDYQGLVMTDWMATGGMGKGAKYDSSTPEGCIMASNDLIMPGRDEELAAIISAAKSGTVSREMLEECASRVLNISEAKRAAKRN